MFPEIFHLVSAKVVAEIVGPLAEQHLAAIDAFYEGISDDMTKGEFVHSSLDWSWDGSYNTYDGDPAFDALVGQQQEIVAKFKEATGMDLCLVYGGDTVDGDIEGYAWYIDFASLYQRTPAYQAFVDRFGETCDWQHYLIKED